MHIRDWLTQDKKTPLWLSKKLKISYDRMCRIIRGKSPEPIEIWKIQEITNMEVTLEDFIKVNRRKAKK